MIISKDRVTPETLIALMQYAQSEACTFLCAVKPPTNIVNDHVFQLGSVVSFLKIEGTVFQIVDAHGGKTYLTGFSIKVLVEDLYWIQDPEKERSYYKSERVPAAVLNRVSEILNVE
jgi:hypothetical protein